MSKKIVLSGARPTGDIHLGNYFGALYNWVGFDDGRRSRGSGSRMHGHLVNAPCKTIGADSKRTDFALAA